MENNMNTQTEASRTQQTGGEITEPKTFTQEEVNRIVQDRLARERKGQTLEARELDLARRESRITCAERLSEAGYVQEVNELLDILDTSDADKFMENVKRLSEMRIRSKNDPPIPRVIGSTPGFSHDGEDADFRSAFGLK